MGNTLSTTLRNASAVITIAILSSPAFALGGLDKAKQTASEIQTGVFALVSVLAILYLIYLGVMAFTEKKSWADFGWGVVHIAAVGSAVALASWAWTAFQ